MDARGMQLSLGVPLEWHSGLCCWLPHHGVSKGIFCVVSSRVTHWVCTQMLLTNNSCLIPLALLLQNVPDTISKLFSAFFWDMSVLPHNSFGLIFFSHWTENKVFWIFSCNRIVSEQMLSIQKPRFFFKKFQKIFKSFGLKNIVGKQNGFLMVLISMKGHRTIFCEICKPLKSFAWTKNSHLRKS